MRLYEEYFRRYKLEHVPMVRHDPVGALILCTQETQHWTRDALYWKSKWIIVTIKWVDGGIHPGTYAIDFHHPIHNGYAKGQLFHKQTAEELEWDEYEDYFINYAKSGHVVPGIPAAIEGERQVVLTAWEVFVYIYDGWFATQTSELREYVDRALDTDLTLNDRYAGYQSCLMYLMTRHPSVLKAWKYEVLLLVQQYSEWLATLVRNYDATQITTSEVV